ncbi:putative btb poz domain containing protein [Botrytis fragariae]|uniref:Putative btb poz domain containing protein n=1 Tax=Botrytis fragariae TaxID=1964551 RepID=A0A8H6AQ27_9HELO|nr:putative btb poz domain containing protein [Botrytis fragariae]KAF5871265.1 putative btb poz domain containing protein [Botrytis fragariae]
MDATEEEVARQLWKEQFAQGERIRREKRVGEMDTEGRGRGSVGRGISGLNLDGLDEKERDGGVRVGGESGGAGYAGYVNAGLGNGSGSGSGNGQFGGRESGLEENEVVLEGPLLALREALLEGRFSDLTIFHGVRVWNAHKVVVCSQSPVLESMIDNTGVCNMFGAPTKPSILNLSSFPLDSIIALLEYLYTSAYSIPSPPPNTSPSSSTYLSGPTYSIPLHEQIFYLASHLQIPALETLAAVSFRHTLHTQISDLDIYFDCIKRIYGKTTTENPGLRNALVEAAVQELEGMLGNGEVKGKLWRVMSENEEFWEEVLRALGRRTEVRVKEVIREVRVPVEVEVEKIVERVVEREVAGEAKEDGEGEEEGESEKEWTLCPDCGPREEGEEYEFRCTCRVCGVERILSFS